MATEPTRPTSGSRRSPLLCTVEEAADMLSIGRTKTYRMIASGELRTVRIGRRRLVPVSELEAFINDLLGAS
jgi:excisionase family DNA binding protein